MLYIPNHIYNFIYIQVWDNKFVTIYSKGDDYE